MKVLYVTSKGSIHDYRFLKKLVNDYDILLLHYAADNLLPEIKAIPGLEIISKKPLIKSFPLISELNHFKKIFNSFKPDIVHSGYLWQVGALAAYAGVHPHLSMPWGSDVLIEPDKNPLFKKLANKVLTSADHVHCDAEYVKKKIINDYSIPSDKITVFPRGIDLGIFKVLDAYKSREALEIPHDKFVIGFSRPFEPLYDLKTLIEGYREFADGKDDVLLLMSHSGSLYDSVKNQIEKYRLTDKVRLTGWMKNDKIPVLLNASDIYVSTSLSDGTSLSLLEAMACGKSLVITKIPTNIEWVNSSNGILIEKRSPGELCAAFNKYYFDRELIIKHGANNLAIAKERADWDKNYLKLKEIYTLISR